MHDNKAINKRTQKKNKSKKEREKESTNVMLF